MTSQLRQFGDLAIELISVLEGTGDLTGTQSQASIDSFVESIRESITNTRGLLNSNSCAEALLIKHKCTP